MNQAMLQDVPNCHVMRVNTRTYTLATGAIVNEVIGIDTSDGPTASCFLCALSMAEVLRAKKHRWFPPKDAQQAAAGRKLFRLLGTAK